VVGSTPTDLASLSETEKRKVLEESFRTRVVTRATTGMAGLRVIQTFEGRVGERFAICVLIRWSKEYARLAEVLRTGQGTIAPAAAGRPLESWIPKQDTHLINTFGVRTFPGPDGEPLLLVFSQSPITVGPNDGARVLEIKRRTALARARTGALRDLTLFVNCTTASEQRLESGESFEQSLTLAPGNLTSLGEGSGALAEALTRTIETHGAAVIHGGTVVRSWTAEHPDTGTSFCGVVFAWSPTRARLALGNSAGGGASGTKGSSRGKSGDDYPVDF